MTSETFRRYGQAEPPVALIPLRAGPLEMQLDPATGFVRWIRYGDREVLRGIYAAVRDHNWGTVAPTLRFDSQQIGADRFRIAFTCDHRRDEIEFIWQGVIEGGADGTLSYSLDGTAQTSFRKNRIGFCVLYPIRECAGAPARQLRTDGQEHRGHFPALIEPQIFGQSSFRQLQGIAHEVVPGCEARVRFEGDTFEMEDQRNWTDASFKVYCTPLLDPFPVPIAAGQRIQQRVTLQLMSSGVPARGKQVAAPKSGELALELPAAPSGLLPHLGLGVASHGEPLLPSEVKPLRELRLSHLRADVRLAAPDAVRTLERALGEAAALGVPLELALYLPRTGESDPRELRSLLKRGGGTRPPGALSRTAGVSRVLTLREGGLATTPEDLAWVRRHFGDLGAKIGAGSDCNFRELNHEHAVHRLGWEGADLVFWSVNPQVHAFDHRSVMETLEAQPATALTARAFAGARPLVVSPVTLRQRFNPVATGAEIVPPPGELPAAVDPRQLSDFAAAWTLGSIAAWTSAQVASVTYFETTGWRGVMECARGSPLADKFPSSAGEIFPLYQVFAGLAGFREAAVVRAGRRGEVVAIALFLAGRLSRVLLANLSPENQRVKLEGWPDAAAAMALSPYEVRRLDARC